MSLSTHVLDATAGRPAAGVPVRHEQQVGDGWQVRSQRVTDDDGRIGDLAADLTAGLHRLVFDTAAYLGDSAFFPEVVVTVRVTDPDARHHVPLLLSPGAYTTYRGS
jgi:5-hydroxyisourate hydrolase